MASGQASWGIDLGRCALRAIKLRPLTEGLVEVVGYTYIEHEAILSDADSGRDTKISQALEKFLSQYDISSDQVAVSVPGQHTLARFSPLPPVEAKKIPDLVRYEADQQIPFDMDEVIWDYQTFQEEDAPDIQVGIFAMKRELMRDYLGHFGAAGIEPVIVQAAPLALYNAMHFDGLLSDETTVVVNIGAENTDLILGSKHTLWTRTIPIGGNNFTEALVKAFKLSFSKAENLKKTAATSKYARRIFQAMRPVFADLVQELQRSIGRYTSAHRDAELTKVIGVGSAFLLPVLQKYLQQNLQLDVVRPETFDKIQIGPGVDEAELKEVLPGFAVAYGLALQGLGLVPIKTNLLPPEIARQVVWRKKRPFFGAAAACLLLASGVIWLRQVRDTGTLEPTEGAQAASVSSLDEAKRIIDSPQSGPPRAQAERVLSAAQFMSSQYQQVSSGGGTEKAKIEQISKLAKNKSVLLRILEVAHQSLPTPGGALGEASTPEAYATAAAESKTLRKNRREMFIEGFSCMYYDDLDTEDILARMNDKSGESDLQLVEAPSGAPRNGFLVTLKCRTPNDNLAQFVNETVKMNLRRLGRTLNAGFYIDRVVMADFARLEGASPTTPDRRPEPSYGPSRGGRGGGGVGGGVGYDPATGGGIGGGVGSGRGGGRRGGGGRSGGGWAPSPTVTSSNNNVDPLTNESMGDDWVFTLRFDVVLANYPEPKSDEGEPSDGA